MPNEWWFCLYHISMSHPKQLLQMVSTCFCNELNQKRNTFCFFKYTTIIITDTAMQISSLMSVQEFDSDAKVHSTNDIYRSEQLIHLAHHPFLWVNNSLKNSFYTPLKAWLVLSSRYSVDTTQFSRNYV